MRQSGIILLVLITSLFFLTDVLAWAFSPAGEWYRPFIIWFILIVIAGVWHRSFYKTYDT